MTTALFLLRCIEIGISIADLDLLTIGMVMDIWTEKGNDAPSTPKSGDFLCTRLDSIFLCFRLNRRTRSGAVIKNVSDAAKITIKFK